MGRTLEELKTIRFPDVCAPAHRDAARDAFSGAWRGEGFTMDTAIITAAAARCELFISGTPAIVEGEVVGISCIAHDITNRKILDRQLQETNVAGRLPG